MQILSVASDIGFTALAKLHGQILGGHVGLVISQVFDVATIDRLVDDYLELSLGGSQFVAISDTAPNWYRESLSNPLSKVPTIVARATMLGMNMKRGGTLHHVAQIICALKGFPTDELFQRPSSGLYWTSTVAYYPSGGGWLQLHKDPEDIFGSIHILLNMSTRGVHYQLGGLYITEENSKVIDVEPLWRAGDLFVFNAEKVSHGVAPIDPHIHKAGSKHTFPKRRADIRGRFSCQITRVKCGLQ